MAPPSIFRSRALQNIYNELQLSDPYRLPHPTKCDYTYIPRNGNDNRSRIDFFLISDSLLPFVITCDIGPNLSTLLFDHKPVFLSFSPTTGNNNRSITKSTFSHPRFEYLLAATTVDTYLHHSVPAHHQQAHLALVRKES
jgi:hypothetical protein